MINSSNSKIRLLQFVIILFVSTLFVCGSNSDSIKISPAEYYPRWLKNINYHTNQTSGITFLQESADSTMQFLLADDIGYIHRLFIKNDTVFSFSEIKFSREAMDYLADFPKLDFEEIFYDKFSGNVYLTIEGNGEDYLSFHGIYKLNFKDDDIFQDLIISIEKLEFNPSEIFYKNLKNNIGYEGFTADENYFYLGLENVQTSEGYFSNYTVIRIADKNTLEIVKEISTENLGISTICGLFSDDNYSLWGIDRNNKRIFKLKLDEYFNISEINSFEVKTVIPGYNNFEYAGSLESITIAADKFLFLVDDPWQAHFIPPDEILNQIDESTKDNFKKFIPVIYKFIIDKY
jgi:hypothetical protein